MRAPPLDETTRRRSHGAAIARGSDPRMLAPLPMGIADLAPLVGPYEEAERTLEIAAPPAPFAVSDLERTLVVSMHDVLTTGRTPPRRPPPPRVVGVTSPVIMRTFEARESRPSQPPRIASSVRPEDAPAPRARPSRPTKERPFAWAAAVVALLILAAAIVKEDVRAVLHGGAAPADEVRAALGVHAPAPMSAKASLTTRSATP